MSTIFKAACVQVNSGADMDENLKKVVALIAEADENGADLVALPEYVSLMPESAKQLKNHSKNEKEHQALMILSAAAKAHKIWLVIGSLPMAEMGVEKTLPRGFVISPEGEVAGRYDKIHLYNVALPNGERYGEGAAYQAGEKTEIIDLPWGKAGFSICYDVRFPQLFNHMAKAGAELFFIPAAFTKFTGEKHWHVLVRARAIETGSFVIAPAMTGKHPKDKETYGHSLIVDPWGKVLADAGEDEGIIYADIDMEEVQKARETIPTLAHERDFS
jgi:predicted amidohydrolase